MPFIQRPVFQIGILKLTEQRLQSVRYTKGEQMRKWKWSGVRLVVEMDTIKKHVRLPVNPETVLHAGLKTDEVTCFYLVNFTFCPDAAIAFQHQNKLAVANISRLNFPT